MSSEEKYELNRILDKMTTQGDMTTLTRAERKVLENYEDEKMIQFPTHPNSN